MSSSFGLTETGFVPKTLTDVQASLEARLRGLLGDAMDFSPRSLWGQVTGVFAGELAEAWEAAEQIYSSLSPDNAVGAGLIDLAAITGTLPLGAIPSTVTLTLVGGVGTTVPTGTVVSISGHADSRFLTDSEVTLAALLAWTSSTAYALGNRRKNSGKAYQCTQAGVSSGISGPASTAALIVDGSAVWTYLGTGDSAADVSSSSEKRDAIAALAGTLTRIDTPVIGLNSVTNILDADVGRATETTQQLRARRELELRQSGTAAMDSIRARVSEVNGVASVAVFQNDTDTTDGDGVPPHSVEVVVDLDAGPPANVADLIRAAIFSAVSGGIRPYGQVTGTVVDASGNNQEVDYSYLTEQPAYVLLALEVTNAYPADGDDQVLAKLLEFETARLIGGYDLVAMQIAAEAFKVPGVFNVPNVQVGLTFPASGARVTATSRQLVTLDSGRIAISHTVVTP